MNASIGKLLLESAELKQRMAADRGLMEDVRAAARQLIATVLSGGTIFTCGNGGSACDAMHFAEELVARYKRPRRGIRARHLLDAGIITCWSNDEDFESSFARQVETFCGPDDTLVVFSTSGNSANAIQAVEAARRTSTFSLGLLGKGGGQLAASCDRCVIVPSLATERIQEAHITLVHILCELIELDLEG